MKNNGTTAFDKLCHKVFEAKSNGTDYLSHGTGVKCGACGHELEAYYCEERLYLVACSCCDIRALVKAGSPSDAAYRTFGHAVYPLDDMGEDCAAFLPMYQLTSRRYMLAQQSTATFHWVKLCAECIYHVLVRMERRLTMTNEEAIVILKNEKACVERGTCQRAECATCDLVMNREDILSALDLAISALRPAPAGEPLTLDQLRETLHGKIKDSTLQNICNRANEIAYHTGHIDRSKWVSVDERLPERDGKYLVAIKDGDGYSISTRKFRKDVPDWYRGWCGHWERRTAGVRFWMPLPEPPRKAV